MSRFRRGGGELDLSQIGYSPLFPPVEGGGGTVGGTDSGNGLGSGARETVTGRRRVDVFAEEDDSEEEEEDDEDDEDDEEEGEEDGERETRRLEDLLWGHEKSSAHGFDTSLEEQVEDM